MDIVKCISVIQIEIQLLCVSPHSEPLRQSLPYWLDRLTPTISFIRVDIIFR